jgi:hypothetical protein
MECRMNRGELLTRLSIWLALVAYTLGAGLKLQARHRANWLEAARWAWTIGCGFFLIHVASAFAYFHHWSHLDAYRETARQTADLTGWHWGGGLYFNYLFATAWLADVFWWWLAPTSFAQRSPRLSALGQGFFFFMVLNGAVVFVHGPLRWFGALLCGSLAALWWRARIAGSAPRT